MTRQLLIYEKVVNITARKHGNLSVKTGNDYRFAGNINSVPAMAAEFPALFREYAIVFTENGETIMPVAIMGLRNDENLYVDEDGQWDAQYIPAFIRRYPFVFSSSDEGKSFTLCIDENYTGCNDQGQGERLFENGGEQTPYLKNVLEFLKEYQLHYQRTEAFSRKLKELNLLEPMTAKFTNAGSETINLTGFMAVNRDKLKQLDGEQFRELAKTDELELIYVHIQSLANFARIAEKFGTAATGSAKSGTNGGNDIPGEEAASANAGKKTKDVKKRKAVMKS